MRNTADSGNDLADLRRYAEEIALAHPWLKGVGERVGLVLAGSRSVGWHLPKSDWDFLALCDEATFTDIARLAGKGPGVKGIDLPMDKESVEKNFDIEVDVSVYETGRVARAMGRYNDVVLWIWTNAKNIFDPTGCVETLKGSFQGYPRDILERKLRQHFLKDFHLSVHAVTYNHDSKNVFSVVHALASKVAEYCRLCCLLDGIPFPYEKWLLRACRETTTGKRVAPLLDSVVDTLTRLEGDLEKNWELVSQAVRTLDTDAAVLLEDALVAWGIEREWIDGAFGDRHDVLFEE
jgi:hypothetical protein